MTKETTIIIRRDETVAESWARDASSFAEIILLIGIGVVLDSSAMQWIGAVMAFLLIIAKGAGLKKRCTYSVEGARKRLDEIEREAHP